MGDSKFPKVEAGAGVLGMFGMFEVSEMVWGNEGGDGWFYLVGWARREGLFWMISGVFSSPRPSKTCT